MLLYFISLALALLVELRHLLQLQFAELVELLLVSFGLLQLTVQLLAECLPIPSHHSPDVLLNTLLSLRVDVLLAHQPSVPL